MGLATLAIQRMLSIDVGFFRTFGVVAAVCLGYFGYKVCVLALLIHVVQCVFM
jgi:hypothetical protein